MTSSSSSSLLFPYFFRTPPVVVWHLSVCVLLLCISDGGVPEHRGALSGGGGRGRIWWRLLPLPAGQDGHTVLFTQILLRPLTSFNLSTQNSLLLDHFHHGCISAEPRHLRTESSLTSTCRHAAPL